MSPRVGQDAIDYARGRIGPPPPPPTGMPDSGLCLAFVREDFAVAALYGSAIDAWHATARPHPGDRNPPPAVPAWFVTPSIYDHVVFHVGDGVCISTFNDEVRQFGSLADVERSFDGSFLGWAEDINGVDIMPSTTPPTTEERDDVARLLVHPNGTIAMVGPGAAFQVLNSMTEVDTVQATGQATGDLIRLSDSLIWDTALRLAEEAGLYIP